MDLLQHQLDAIANNETPQLSDMQLEELYKIVKKVVNKFNFEKNDFDDIVQFILTEILNVNIKNFNPNKSKFSTFVYHAAYIYCCRIYNDNKKKGKAISLDVPLKKQTSLDLLQDIKEKKLTKEYKELLYFLCKNKYQLLYQNFFERKSFKELAINYNCSQSQIYKKIHDEMFYLKQDLKKFGYESYEDAMTL